MTYVDSGIDSKACANPYKTDTHELNAILPISKFPVIGPTPDGRMVVHVFCQACVDELAERFGNQRDSR